MSNVIVAPSILSGDFSKLGSEIKRLEEKGADWVHIDVMDGHFVENITIGAPVIKSIRKITNLPFDVHLMIENPFKYLDDFLSAGADIITVHAETEQNKIFDIIDKIHFAGKKAGISIKPKTQAEEIIKYLDKIDLVLVMTVEPGFGGQKFIMECAKKIRELSKIVKKDTIIEVDGGINDKTAQICVQNGAGALVAGNYVFSSEDMKTAIQSLRCK